MAKTTKGLANPTLLKPVDKADGLIQVIVETPRNSRNKFAFDQKQNIFVVIKRLNDLPRKFLRELEEFFVNYHRLEGKKYRLLGCKSANVARRMIRKAQRAA